MSPSHVILLIFFFKSSWCKIAIVPQGIESIPSPKQQRRPLPSLMYLSFFYMSCRGIGINPVCIRQLQGTYSCKHMQTKNTKINFQCPQKELFIQKSLVFLLRNEVVGKVCYLAARVSNIPGDLFQHKSRAIYIHILGGFTIHSHDLPGYWRPGHIIQYLPTEKDTLRPKMIGQR